ncbi:MAG: hypothetical protein FWD00_04015 [Clostridiales bacterium]|nr:hypothetical protein [Clostridiales bacterium]
MKIFIAGPRAITQLDSNVTNKLFSIYEKGYDVLVGDATGVDHSVQKFYAEKAYGNVTVFASNGKARNNIGRWKVENVTVEHSEKGFDFYSQKDIAMANQADYGFMVWNGESKGTLHNIINLIAQKKTCLVYLTTHNQFFSIDNEEKCLQLLSLCPESAGATYIKLTKRKIPLTQIAMF